MKIRAMGQGCVVALQLLTVIPIKYSVKINTTNAAFGLAWFPVIALLTAVCICLPLYFISDTALLSSSWVIVMWVLVTGALHLDGLADCADALMAGHHDSNLRLKILKDPHCGVIAVCALIILLGLKFVSVYLLTDQAVLAVMMIVVFVRSLLPLLMTYYPSPKSHMIQPFANVISLKMAFLIHLIPVVIMLFLGLSVLQLFFWYAVGFGLIHYLVKAFSGLRGDVLGAWIELMEVLLLSLFIVLT